MLFQFLTPPAQRAVNLLSKPLTYLASKAKILPGVCIHSWIEVFINQYQTGLLLDRLNDLKWDMRKGMTCKILNTSPGLKYIIQLYRTPLTKEFSSVEPVQPIDIFDEDSSLAIVSTAKTPLIYPSLSTAMTSSSPGLTKWLQNCDTLRWILGPTKQPTWKISANIRRWLCKTLPNILSTTEPMNTRLVPACC